MKTILSSLIAALCWLTAGFEQLCTLSAQAWILVDDSTGMIISQKYADEPRPIASLTKMMTCLLALENGVMKDTVSINPINWKRDETYAPASENKGSLRPNKETGEYEIQHPFFYNNIKDNAAKRIATYKANH
ncbi:MAG: hypothetical protein IKI06_10010 [Prevotella sp.]|nr:hypothetical protein [Prevotella sp.]